MVERGHEVHLLHSESRADPDLLAEIRGLPGVRCQAFDMRREIGLYDLRVVWSLMRYLRKWGPFDVIHGHSAKGGGYARLLGIFLPGRIVYTAHAMVTMAPHLEPAKRTFYSVLERGLALFSHTLICTSDLERRHALGLGISSQRLAVVANGIACFDSGQREAVRAKLGIPDTAVLVGFVGRLDAQKAPHILVQAVPGLLNAGGDVRVAIIGDGPLKAEVEDLARRSGADRAIIWMGAVNAKEIMPAFDILALPSSYEGFAYVLLEALVCGLPIVCTPIGGSEEAVEEGVNGFVVPHNDPQALAEKIGLLVRDPELRAEMSRRSLDHSKRYSLEAMTDRTEAVYRR